MKEYKFRGKSDDEWVYGMLLKINQFDCGEHGEFKDNKYMIQSDELEMGEYNKYFITDDNSIGQFTGLHDKNGKEIYEGDIIRATKRTDLELNYHNFKVFMHNGCYMFGNYNAHEFFDKFNFKEVIGNIYENKELLNETD